MDEERDKSNQVNTPDKDPIDPNERSDYFDQSSDICRRKLSLYLDKLEIMLVDQHPDLEVGINERILALRTLTPLPAHSSFIKYNGKLMIANPYNPRDPVPVINLTKAIYVCDATLGQMDYIDRSGRVGFSHNPSTKKSLTQSDKNYYPEFAKRFNTILESSNLDLTNPLIKILALNLFLQIPKRLAVYRTDSLLNHVINNTYRISPSVGIDAFFNNINKQYLVVLNDLAAVEKGLGDITRIADANGIDSLQQQLLFELAFIPTKDLNWHQEFTLCFIPILTLIKQGNWQEAYKHRDFLLKYLPDLFPQENHIESPLQQDGSKSYGLKEVVNSVREGTLLLSMNDIPSQYLYLFAEAIPTSVHGLNSPERNNIIKLSVPLSLALLKTLSSSDTTYSLPIKQDKFIRITNIKLQYYEQLASYISYNEGRPIDVNFGKLLYLALLNFEQNNLRFKPGYRESTLEDRKSHGQLTLDDVRILLTQAYNCQKSIEPNITYTLKDYLIALISSWKELACDDSILQFIQGL